MIFDILTIFPKLLESPLDEGILRRAISAGKISTNIINIRDFAYDTHTMTDDRPFGGGEGMGKVILLTPQGRQYTQSVAKELAKESHLILVCGRYEGVDERFRSAYVDVEISIGDFILTGGELAAMVVIDSVTRLLPGVLGCTDSAEKDTFYRNLLKHPQYTRPRIFQDRSVPEELLSGNHGVIEEYRFIASVKRTLERRPEFMKDVVFSDKEKKTLRRHKLLDAVTTLQSRAV